MMTEPTLLVGVALLLAAALAGFTAGRRGRRRVQAPNPPRSSAPAPDPSTPAPAPGWTRNIDAVLVSIDVALLVAKPDDLARAYRDHPRVAKIARQIEERGQDTAIEILVDAAGRCSLREGHHRLVATTTLGRTEIAAQFIEVPQRTPGYARRADQVLSALARTSRRRPAP